MDPGNRVLDALFNMVEEILGRESRFPKRNPITQSAGQKRSEWYTRARGMSSSDRIVI